MKLLVLGTRGEIPESLSFHSKHSGILVDNEFLIDFGEKSFFKYNPKWILISHFHPDHAYFVRRKNEEVPPVNSTIYAPEKLKWLENKITVIDKKTKIGPYTVIPIPTHHSKHVKSQAYVIQKGKSSFLYTGDLVWIDKIYHSLIGEVNLVITEASFLKKGGMVKRDSVSGQIYGHNGIPNLLSLLKPFSKHILLVHFGSWFYKDTKAARKTLMALGKDYGVQIKIGYDGQSIDMNHF